MATKSQENKKLSEYKKKLRDLRKLYEAVKTFSVTDEKYRLQTFIKIGGCGTFISIMEADILQKDFKHFDRVYPAALVFLTQSLQIITNLQDEEHPRFKDVEMYKNT